MCLGGIPGDHLIVPVSGHSVTSPMHLRLGQKDKVWTGEYLDKEEKDAMDRIESIDEEEEKHYLDEEDKVEFEGKGWNHNEEDNEVVDEEGDQAELEWEIPAFQSKPIQHPHSQQRQYCGPQQKADEDGDVLVEDTVSQARLGEAFSSHFSRNRALRRLRRWQRLQSHGGLGLRLTQHWKNWRQRAQWVCSQGNWYNRRWQRYSLYGKQRRLKRYQQSTYTNGEDDSNEKRFPVSERGTSIHYTYFQRKCSQYGGILYKSLAKMLHTKLHMKAYLCGGVCVHERSSVSEC